MSGRSDQVDRDWPSVRSWRCAEESWVVNAGPAVPSWDIVVVMPRISYFPLERLDDRELMSYLEHAARYGAPRPESQAIRAHVPAVLRSFSQNWQRTFRTGVVEHSLKELCRVYVSKTIDCHY